MEPIFDNTDQYCVCTKLHKKMDRNTIRKPIQSSHSFPAPITPPKDNHPALLLTCKPCYDPREQRYFNKRTKGYA